HRGRGGVVRRRVRIARRGGHVGRGADRRRVGGRAVIERHRHGERRRGARRERGQRARHGPGRAGGRRAAVPARGRGEGLQHGVVGDRGGELDVGGRQVVVGRIERLLVGVDVVVDGHRVGDGLARGGRGRRGGHGGRQVRARDLQRVD